MTSICFFLLYRLLLLVFPLQIKKKSHLTSLKGSPFVRHSRTTMCTSFRVNRAEQNDIVLEYTPL